MLVVKKGRYRKQHVVGGAGIFDSLAGIFKRVISSNATKSLTSSLMNAGKNAAAEIGKKAIDAGKDVAIVAGKRLVEQVAEKLSSKGKQRAISKSSQLPLEPIPLTQKSKDVLAQLLVNDGRSNSSPNINNLLAGGSLGAIKIQDLVRLHNGAGMKMV